MAKFSCAAGGNPIIVVQPWVVETSLGNVLGLTPQQYREILIQMQTTRLRHYLFAAEFVLNPGRAEAGSNTHTHTPENNLELSPASPNLSGSSLIPITVEFSQ